MPWLQPVTLRGQRVNLEPLDQRHCDDLVEAVKDGALWTLWYTSVPSPETMQAEIATARGSGANPMSDADLSDKLRRCAAGAGLAQEHIDHLLERLWRIDALDDCGAVLADCGLPA